MAQEMTLRDAFAYFNGAKGRNPQWSWSARSPDGRTVVLTLWEDHIRDDGTTVRVDMFATTMAKQTGQQRTDRQSKFMRAIIAVDCSRVVMITAKDPTVRPRSIAKRYPHPTLMMKLIDLDETTGEFCAESVSR